MNLLKICLRFPIERYFKYLYIVLHFNSLPSGVASVCDDQNSQNKVIGAATNCALATSHLVACTKVRNDSKINFNYIFLCNIFVMELFYRNIVSNCSHVFTIHYILLVALNTINCTQCYL